MCVGVREGKGGGTSWDCHVGINVAANCFGVGVRFTIVSCGVYRRIPSKHQWVLGIHGPKSGWVLTPRIHL